jgi:hypothetical protein
MVKNRANDSAFGLSQASPGLLRAMYLSFRVGAHSRASRWKEEGCTTVRPYPERQSNDPGKAEQPLDEQHLSM